MLIHIAPCPPEHPFLALPQVWQLRLTLHFLADAGNLLDCASLAAMTALRHLRKPEVQVTGDEIIFVSEHRTESEELPLPDVPARGSFALT